MRATQAITAAVTEVSSQLQDDGKNTGGEASTSGPSGRRSDLSLQLPSRGLGFGNKNSGKGLLSSQNSLKGSPSSGGLLRGLSFKKKVAPPDGERRFLPNSETNTVPDSPILATLKSALSRQRCASLPFQRASDLSPSTATEVTPASARMPGESHKKNKGAVHAVVSRSLSLQGQNVFIVLPVTFSTHKEHASADPGGDQTTPDTVEGDDEEIPEEEAVCRICLDECQ